MSSIRNFWLKWGAIGVVGGGAYYFSKKMVVANRTVKLEEFRRKEQAIEAAKRGDGNSPRTDPSGSPSQEASNDPAPTRHAPSTEYERLFEKSKYEASAPYSSPKGDRFS